jgi:hypothetical protein
MKALVMGISMMVLMSGMSLDALAGEGRKGCRSACGAKKAPYDKEMQSQTTCPVMGGKINRDLYVDADGKRIYVCCKGCIQAVQDNPDKYLEKLRDQNVKIEDAPKEKKASGSQQES